MTPIEALRRLVDAVCHVGDWPDGSRVGSAVEAAELALEQAPTPTGPPMLFSSSLPISAARINGRFVAVARGRAVTSKAYRGFKESLADDVAQQLELQQLPPILGPCVVSMQLPWERTCREAHNDGIPLGDVDSPVKCVLDALKFDPKTGRGGAFIDDSQVVTLVASKWPRPKNLIVEVIPCTL